VNADLHPKPLTLLPEQQKKLDSTRFGCVETVPETGSTNADLLLRTDEKGLVLTAQHQTAGRGRLDRTWEAPPGANLLFSVVVQLVAPPERTPLVTPALALALVNALKALAVEAQVKWPNDVLLSAGGKVAGILAQGTPHDPQTVIVGMGCNIGWPLNDDGPPGATSLAAVKVNNIDPADLLVQILVGFEKQLKTLETANGDELLRQELLECSATIGQQVSVEQSVGDLTGRAVDLKTSGELVIENEEGRQVISVGDVIHLRAL